MTKPKFTIRTLLWLMIVVAAFFAGRELVRRPLMRELNALKIELEARTSESMAIRQELELTTVQMMDLEVELALKEQEIKDTAE